MKKKALILTLLIISVNCIIMPAQTSKGRFLIGDFYKPGGYGDGQITSMNIGYNTSTWKSDNDKDSNPRHSFNINLTPRAGYFVLDNLATGVGLHISHFRTTWNDSEMKYYTLAIGAGPYIRYYLPVGKVTPYAELSSSFGAYKTHYSDTNNFEEYKSSSMILGGGLGLAFFLGKRVSFDMLAGYDQLTLKPLEDNDENAKDIYGSLGLKLGFSVLLGSAE